MEFAAGYWPYSGLLLYSFPDGAWLAIAAAVLLAVAAVRSYRNGERLHGSTVALIAVVMVVTGIVTVVYTNRTLAKNISSLEYGEFPYKPASWTVAVAGFALAALLLQAGISARKRNPFVAVACLLAVPAAFALLLQGKLMLALNDEAALRVTYAWLAEAVLVAVVAIVWLASLHKRHSTASREVTD